MKLILKTSCFFLFVLSAPFFACTTTDKDINPQEISKDEVMKEAPQASPYIPWPKAQLVIDQGGKSWSGVYSPAGGRVRLTSTARTGEAQAEIFELNLKTNDVERLTFQSGFAEEPLFLASQPGVIYRSTTDELKESPSLFREYDDTPFSPVELPYREPLMGFELYFRPMKSADPIRLTKHPGFDGFMTLHPGPDKSLVYSSAEAGQLDLKRITVNNLKAKPEVLRSGPYHEAFPLYSSDGQSLYFIEIQTDPLQSRFFKSDANAKNETLLASFDGLAITPSLSPSGERLYFSGRKSTAAHFEIFALNIEGRCFEPVLGSQAHLESPQESPENSSFLFTALFEDKVQVYQLPQVPEIVSCSKTSRKE